MIITLVASGSRGDVQPYIALGKGLKEAGYIVRVLTNDDFEGLTREAGLAFYSMGGSIEAVLQSEEWRKLINSGNFLTILRGMNRTLQAHAGKMAAKLPTLLEGSDLIIAGVGGMGGAFSVAEKRNIPILQAYLFPLTPTAAFPSPLTANLPFGQLLNRHSYITVRQLLWQSGRIMDAKVRKDLRMSGSPFFGPYRTLQRNQIPILYGFSGHVLPKPPDWDALTHVTGYWFLDPPPEWTPPSDLTDFLANGTPPVYIGFGSMGNRDPQATTQLILDALDRTGQRGILTSGWGGMGELELPKNVYMLKSVPHSWLFPQMAAVIHHGGAGTTAAGLRAGIPSVIVPFFGDQPFWGHRVAQLGVGTDPLPKKQLTVESLAKRITETVTDQRMRDRAAELGRKIQAEQGVANAVALIQKSIHNRKSAVK